MSKNYSPSRNAANLIEPMFTLFLAERFDCHFFRDVQSGLCPIPDGYELVSVPSAGNVMVIRYKSAQELTIVSGRQIVTKDRLEVLALGIDREIPDGVPTGEVLSEIRGGGGIPVLNWAPGKWFFKRGKVVKDLIASSRPQDFLIGDTTLRPWLWPEPQLMQQARKKGFTVLAGSDPLPFSGEEKQVGTYGNAFELDLDAKEGLANFVPTLRHSVGNQSLFLQTLGTRGGVRSVLKRLVKNQSMKEGRKV